MREASVTASFVASSAVSFTAVEGRSAHVVMPLRDEKLVAPRDEPSPAPGVGEALGAAPRVPRQ
jgi:hypothetical protein